MSISAKSPAGSKGSTLKALGMYRNMLFGKDSMLPDGILDRLLSAKNLLVTIDNPWNADIEQGVNALISNTLTRNPVDDGAARKAAHPALWAMYEQRYDPLVDLRRLEKLPEGTLGRTYADFMSRYEIRQLQDMVKIRRPRNFAEYTIYRAYKLHDVMHSVLGCDAEILGEVRINAWSAGQGLAQTNLLGSKKTRNSSHGFMGVAVLLMHIAYKRSQDFPEALSLALEWMERGRKDPFHIPLKVEELWEQPLGDVREYYQSGRFLAAD